MVSAANCPGLPDDRPDDESRSLGNTAVRQRTGGPASPVSDAPRRAARTAELPSQADVAPAITTPDLNTGAKGSPGTLSSEM